MTQVHIPPFVKDVVARAANKWARRVPWVDEADLQQHAWCELLQVAPSFKDNRGTWYAYAHTIAHRCCARYCAENAAPVTGSVREAEYRLRLLTCTRFALDAPDATGELPELPAAAPTQCTQYEEASTRYRVRQRLAALVGRDDAVFLLLAQKYPPRELAEHYNCKPRVVSDRLWKLQQICRRDIELRLLWSEL